MCMVISPYRLMPDLTEKVSRAPRIALRYIHLVDKCPLHVCPHMYFVWASGHPSRKPDPGVLLYETKFQLRERTTFFWLRLLLPFFFYAIDGRTVYGVGLFPKKTAQKRRRSSLPKLQQAQSGCL